MARVFLTSAIQNVDSDYNSRSFNAQKDLTRLVRAAQTCAFREHTLATDACDADLIIFVGSARTYHEDVRRSAVLRAFRDKCFMFDAADKVIPFLPGVYASIEKRWHWPGWTRSGFYLNVIDNESIGFRTPPAGASLLFSFVGSAGTAAVRRRIMRLDHPNCHLADMQNQGAVYNHQMPERVRLYADVMEKSKFVLCPRGVGASSWRLFETMKMGRAAVIISDQWVPPVGPDWAAFTIRVPEKEVAGIPHLLAARAHEAERMGAIAREQWEQWFSEKSCFHRIATWCCELKARRRLPMGVLRWLPYAQLLRPGHLRCWGGQTARALLRSARKVESVPK